MVPLRPYLSLDLETTGLDTERSHILQIGWVMDDGVSPIPELYRGSVIIKEDEITYGEPVALGMNGWLFQEMNRQEPKYPVVSLGTGLYALANDIQNTSKLCVEFDIARGEKKPSIKIQLAGKNVGPFDFALLVNNAKRWRNTIDPTFWPFGKDCNQKLIDHRFIDVGGIYFDQFGKVPGFNSINKSILNQGNTPGSITHDALDDAIANVVAIRHKMGFYSRKETDGTSNSDDRKDQA